MIHFAFKRFPYMLTLQIYVKVYRFLTLSPAYLLLENQPVFFQMCFIRFPYKAIVQKMHNFYITEMLIIKFSYYFTNIITASYNFYNLI